MRELSASVSSLYVFTTGQANQLETDCVVQIRGSPTNQRDVRRKDNEVNSLNTNQLNVFIQLRWRSGFIQLPMFRFVFIQLRWRSASFSCLCFVSSSFSCVGGLLHSVAYVSFRLHSQAFIRDFIQIALREASSFSLQFYSCERIVISSIQSSGV